VAPACASERELERLRQLVDERCGYQVQIQLRALGHSHAPLLLLVVVTNETYYAQP
jgi:hypothetical protein